MRAPTLLPLALILLAGCGAASSPEAAGPAGPQDASLRVAAVELTEGRTGAATRAAGPSAPRELSRGGELDPSDPPAGPDRLDGVGAGDACADADLAPGAGTLDRVQAATLCLLNGERSDAGLAPLDLDARLGRAARAHAADMVAKSYFDHKGADGSDIRDRIQATGYLPSSERWVIGENLAWGTGALATPKAIVNAWMNSAGHRANVLHREYRDIGFGIVLGNPKASSGFGATYANAFGLVGDGGSVEPSAARRSAAARRRAAARRSARRARASWATSGRVVRARAALR